eukprot:1159221-Pelagomonas_calceolata.AAC.17
MMYGQNNAVSNVGRATRMVKGMLQGTVPGGDSRWGQKWCRNGRHGEIFKGLPHKNATREAVREVTGRRGRICVAAAMEGILEAVRTVTHKRSCAQSAQ